MKKTMFVAAAAIVGLSAIPASAQTNVTIYGVADAGLQRTDDGASTVNSVVSGAQSGSRLGFKGTEDLGGGLSALFTLESGFTLNDGKLAQGGRLFGRQSFVGLAGDVGTLRLGRIYNPIRPALESVDPFQFGLAGNISRVFKAYDERADNTVNYTTPKWNGVTGQLAWSFGGVPAGATLGRQIGASVGYANGPVLAVLAYHNQNLLTATNTDNGNAKSTFVGGVYDFGAAKAHLGYAWNKGSSAAGVDNVDSRDLLAGVTVPVGGAGNLLASYIRHSDKLVANRDARQWALGYTWDLSKRTNLYTSYARVNNDSASTLGGAAAAGLDPSLLNVGIRHKF
jgi:predicted porin